MDIPRSGGEKRRRQKTLVPGYVFAAHWARYVLLTPCDFSCSLLYRSVRPLAPKRMADTVAARAPPSQPDGVSRPARPAEGNATRAGVLPLWLGPAIFLGLFIIFFLASIWFFRQETYRTQMKELITNAESLSESLRLRLAGNREYLQMIAKERGEELMDDKSFRERASSYVAAHPELICIAWVNSGYFITDVAPFAANRQIIGLRLDLPEPKRASRLAMETRQPVYTRPFQVIQGGLAFELWVPVFENGVFVGLFGGVYAYEGVVRSLTSPQLLQANDVDLVDASGNILLELPNTGTVDQELIYEVPLTPAENEVRLRLSGHRQIPFEWGLLSLEAVCFALVLGMAYAMLALKRENEQRRRAENEVLNEREHLEEMVAARTADLAAANANLDAANKELETFAYSVSHDLRAPLRAIGGFSCMIIDDYGPKLDSEGRRLLNVVRDSALKISRMIEDILSFSRVGRAELTAAPIDMKALVQAAIAELAPATTGRNVSFAVGELPPARGDASMFQRVWTNLLDNAVKYTNHETGGADQGRRHRRPRRDGVFRPR